MNRLPKVLQNEIWEYVRGDRAYWKQTFTNMINLQEFSEIVDVHWFTGGVLDVVYVPELRQWWVRKYDLDSHPVAVSPLKMTREDAIITFNQFKDRHKF
jgi:hypothetical protein